MQHGGVENHVLSAKREVHQPLFRHMRLAAVAAAIAFLLFSGPAHADSPGVSNGSPSANAAPAAATTGTCPGNCTGTAPEIAHCETSTGSGDSSCGGKCSAKTSLSCPTGCSGNFFVALGSSESGNSYSTDNAQGCVGQWQFCNTADATRFCHSMPEFHANTNSCQDQDIIGYETDNWNGIKKVAQGMIGQSITLNGHSYTMTQAGLMGVAHLCGVGGFMEWTKTHICPPGGGDAGGTGGTMYFINFNGTALPPQFQDASSAGGSCTQAAGGHGGANPSLSATSPYLTPASPLLGGGSSSNSNSSMMTSMMPMMMMPMMMMMNQMMSGMMNSSKNGASGSTGASDGSGSSSSQTSPLVSALQSLLNGSPSNNSGTPSAQQQSLQELEQQLEAEQQSGVSGGPAIGSQPNTPASVNSPRDYRISCASQLAHPTLEDCRKFVPSDAPPQ